MVSLSEDSPGGVTPVAAKASAGVSVALKVTSPAGERIVMSARGNSAAFDAVFKPVQVKLGAGAGKVTLLKNNLVAVEAPPSEEKLDSQKRGSPETTQGFDYFDGDIGSRTFVAAESPREVFRFSNAFRSVGLPRCLSKLGGLREYSGGSREDDLTKREITMDKRERSVDKLEAAVVIREQFVIKGEESFKQLDQSVAKIEEAVPMLNQSVAKIKESEQSVGKLDQSVGKMELSVGKMELSVGKMEQSVDKLEQSVPRLEGSVTKLEGSVTKLEGSVTKLEGSVAKLEGSVAKLEGSVAKLEGSVAKLVDIISKAENTKSEEGTSREDGTMSKAIAKSTEIVEGGEKLANLTGTLLKAPSTTKQLHKTYQENKTIVQDFLAKNKLTISNFVRFAGLYTAYTGGSSSTNIRKAVSDMWNGEEGVNGNGGAKATPDDVTDSPATPAPAKNSPATPTAPASDSPATPTAPAKNSPATPTAPAKNSAATPSDSVVKPPK